MSVVTIEQFSTYDFTTEVIGAGQLQAETPTEADLTVTIQGSQYTLKLVGIALQYTGGALTGGTITSLSVNTIPGGGAASSQQLLVAGLDLPVATFHGIVANHNDAGLLSALFGGNDTFNFPGPGPSTIDGGGGTNTLKLTSSSQVDGFGVSSHDGSSFELAVAGQEGVAYFTNIQQVAFSDQTLATSPLLPIIEVVAAYTGGLAVQASALPMVEQMTSQSGGFQTFETEIANDPNGALPQLVASQYQAYLGRDATAQETSYWVGAFQAGSSDYKALTSALAGQSGAAAHLTDSILQVFETFTGGALTAAQLGADKALVGAGFRTIAEIEQQVATSPAASAGAEATAVAGAYADFVGRAPSSGETSYWTGQMTSGAITLGELHSLLVSTSDGAARIGADVGQLYETLVGRDPTSDETAFWTGQVQSGQVNVDQLRVTLEGTAQSQAFVPQLVDGLYDSFIGREPGPAETAYWTGLVETGVLQAAQVQQALASLPGAAALIQGDVAADYQRDIGRAPSAGELAFWTGQVQGGFGLGALDRLLIGTGDGQAHAGAEVNALYQSYFGHGASASELGYWTPQVQSGQTSYAQIADVLATIGGAGVLQTTATSGPDRYAFSGAFGHIVISNFDPNADTLAFTGRPGLLPLAHTQTVADGSGHFDALITLDPTDTILLKGLTLGQLHASDFLVS